MTYISEDQRIDIGALLQPIPGKDEAGEDLFDSDLYREIEEALREEEDLPQGPWGRDIKKARWDEAYEKTIDVLTTKSKDLQIAVWLVHVLVKKQGFVGLQDGLQLLCQLHERFWASFYPKLNGEQTKERRDVLDGFDADLPLLIRQIPLTQQPVYSWLDWQQSQRVEEAEPEDGNDEDQASHYNRSLAEQFEEAVRSTSCSFYEGACASGPAQSRSIRPL